MASITNAGTASAEVSASTSSHADWDSSATRTDIAVFVAVLFFSRFTLPYRETFLGLNFPVIITILLYQFLRGKLVIPYDRLLWFLLLAFAVTCSLMLNFKSYMLTGYLQFTVLYLLFTLNRISSPEQYRRTLQAFQFLVMILSCIGVVQFFAQFAVNGEALMNFYGIVPDIFLQEIAGPRFIGHNILKSNAIFLGEPSALSQLAALGILIEVLEFRRPKYLIAITLGFLMAYSGTGLILLLCFLPFAGLRHAKAALSALLVIVFALALVATGIIDVSAFTSRVSELNSPGSSGYGRFTTAFLFAAVHFHTASLPQLLIGTGPGAIRYINSTELNMWYLGGTSEWLKIVYEYGIIGTFIFGCFLMACLRRSNCPGVVRAAIIFAFVFLQAGMVLAIPLCTLNGSKLRRRVDEPGRYGGSLAAASGSG